VSSCHLGRTAKTAERRSRKDVDGERKIVRFSLAGFYGQTQRQGEEEETRKNHGT